MSGTLKIRTIVCGSFEENAYLVYREDREDALLIDPGDDMVQCLQAVRESGHKLTDIVLTHGHFDHSIGAYHVRSLTGARIAMHSADAYMLADGEKALCTEKTGLDHFVPCTPDVLLDGQNGVYAVCGLPFRVLHTPGHSRGSVCLYLPEMNLLFSGDTIFAHGFGRTDFEGGDLTALRASLRGLFALPAETVILPGHGDSGKMQLYHMYLKKE